MSKLFLQTKIKLPLIKCKKCKRQFALVEYEESSYEQVQPSETKIRSVSKYCPFCGED